MLNVIWTALLTEEVSYKRPCSVFAVLRLSFYPSWKFLPGLTVFLKSAADSHLIILAPYFRESCHLQSNSLETSAHNSYTALWAKQSKFFSWKPRRKQSPAKSAAAAHHPNTLGTLIAPLKSLVQFWKIVPCGRKVLSSTLRWIFLEMLHFGCPLPQTPTTQWRLRNCVSGGRKKKNGRQMAGAALRHGKKIKKKEREERENNKALYLSRAELSSSSRWASDVFPSLDRASILFIMTSSMSLIFLRTPRDSTPPSTGKDSEWRWGARIHWMVELDPAGLIYQEVATVTCSPLAKRKLRVTTVFCTIT